VKAFAIYPPANEVPVPWSTRTLLISNDDLAVGIFGGDLYSSGFVIRLAVRFRIPLFPAKDVHLITARVAERSAEEAQYGLDFSVTYEPKGSQGDSSDDRTSAAFRFIQSSGTTEACDMSIWVTPRPEPTESAVIIVSWPYFDLGFSEAVFDGIEFDLSGSPPLRLW
jgi:hypothetical protein